MNFFRHSKQFYLSENVSKTQMTQMVEKVFKETFAN